jgi:hypothetical protein
MNHWRWVSYVGRACETSNVLNVPHKLTINATAFRNYRHCAGKICTKVTRNLPNVNRRIRVLALMGKWKDGKHISKLQLFSFLYFLYSFVSPSSFSCIIFVSHIVDFSIPFCYFLLLWFARTLHNQKFFIPRYFGLLVWCVIITHRANHQFFIHSLVFFFCHPLLQSQS